MADSNVDITAGIGTSIDTRTESTNGHHRQVIVIGDPATNAGVAPVDVISGLRVNLATGSNPVGKFIPFDGTNNLGDAVGRPMYVQATLATLPVVQGPSVGGSLTAFQGGSPWLVTFATLPLNLPNYANETGGNLDSIVTTLGQIKAKTDNLDVTLSSRLASGGTLPITGQVSSLAAGGSLTSYQGGNWTIQPGNTPNTTAWLVTMGTIPIVGSLAGQATVTSIQGDSGSKAWLTTLATLPVQASQVGTWTVQPGNTPNTTAWLVTMATIPVVTSLSGSVGQGAAGSSAWLVTQATLPVVASGTVSALAAGGSLTAYQGGTWTVQPGSTPNTIGWLITQATLPVVVGTHAVSQSGTWTVQPGNTPNTTAWLVTLATLSTLNAGKYLPTLLSLASDQYREIKLDLFGNVMVNPNTPLPNSTRFNRFLTFASMASIMAAPGAGKRLVVREVDFSGNATLSIKLVEDHAGTPVTVWGPHYFLPYSGFIKPTCYIPITANKSLGVDISGTSFNSTLDIRIETENV